MGCNLGPRQCSRLSRNNRSSLYPVLVLPSQKQTSSASLLHRLSKHCKAPTNPQQDQTREVPSSRSGDLHTATIEQSESPTRCLALFGGGVTTTLPISAPNTPSTWQPAVHSNELAQLPCGTTSAFLGKHSGLFQLCYCYGSRYSYSLRAGRSGGS